MRLGEFVILCDTREQHPWKFESPCIPKMLEAGDYTLQGMESVLRIERKGSVGEFVRNCSSDWPRFKAALERLAKFRHVVIVCAFNMRDILSGKWPGQVPPETVLGRLSEIMLDMRIPVLLAGGRAKEVVETMLIRYWNRNR